MILSAASQGESICVWAEVDLTTTEKTEEHFDVFGTGHDVPPGNRKFIGTVFLIGGQLVFHVYHVLKE